MLWTTLEGEHGRIQTAINVTSPDCDGPTSPYCSRGVRLLKY